MEPDRPAPDDAGRLAEFMDIIAALAAGKPPPRATILGDGSVLDGIGTGLNMLSEEVADRRAQEQDYQRRLMHAERLAAVGQLAAGVAHEINNPAAFILANLTVAQGYAVQLAAAVAELRRALAPYPDAEAVAARVLQEADVDGVLHDLAQLAAEDLVGVRRITGIARALLGFSRVQTDRITPTRLDEVAEEACRIASPEIGQRARLSRRFEPVPAVAADHGKLVQVATNLLLNAAQSIPEGAPAEHEVEVVTRIEGAHVVLGVRDTGCGIPAEVQPRIFEPFFTTKPRGVGTGLGLPISAEIVRLHGGEIRFRSAAGEGSTFEVVIPVLTGLALSSVGPPPPRPAAPGRPRVLIVDDEPALLAAYQRTVGRDYDLTVASSGAEAIAAIERRQDWQAIICDVVMPEIDGLAVLRHVEARHPALRRRMVLCSGGVFGASSSSFAEKLGAQLLSKPLEREDIARVVRQLSGPAPDEE